MIEYILSFDDIDVNELDEKSQTPLHLACSLNRLDVIQLLMNNDNINDTIRNVDQKLPLDLCKSDQASLIILKAQQHFNTSFEAVIKNYINNQDNDEYYNEILNYLNSPRSSILNLSYIDPISQSTLLHTALNFNHFKIIKEAFEKSNAKPDIKDGYNRSLIDCCKDDQIKSFIKFKERQLSNNDDENIISSKNKKGFLKKYVNMASGWQSRYFVLENNILSYYLSKEDELKKLCRGSINLEYGKLKNDYHGDVRKFEVHSSNQKFLLKADHPTDAESWKHVINLNLNDIKNNSNDDQQSDNDNKNSLNELNTSPSNNESRLSFSTSRHSKSKSQTSLNDFNSIHGSENIDDDLDLNNIPYKSNFELESEKISAHVEATASLMNTFFKNENNDRDVESKEERKSALKSSIEMLNSLISEYKTMVNERERYYEKLIIRHQQTSKLWEDNIANIAAESVKIENELKDVHRSQYERRKEIKGIKDNLSLNPPEKVAIHQSNNEHPNQRIHHHHKFNNSIVNEKDSNGISIPPLAATSAPLKNENEPSPMSKSNSNSENDNDDDDDDDDFFDAVEEGNLEFKEKEDKDVKDYNEDPPIEDLKPYEPYRELRKEMPISDDKRPAISLWSVLKNSIGKDLTKISFPVMFNEPTSMLQRMAEDMEFTECLDLASNSVDSCKRVAYVAAFAASNYSSTMGRIAKPFNPMLGETFEYCRFDKQYRYFSEQVSHHPPMSACWGESPKWIYKGEVDAKNKFLGTSFEIRPTGVAHVELKIPAEWAKEGVEYPKDVDKKTGKEYVIEHYSWKKVTTAVTGFITGAPVIDHFGDLTVLNHRTGENCTLSFKARPWRGKGQEIKGFVNDSNNIKTYTIAGRWITQLVAKRISSNNSNDNHNDNELEPDHEMSSTNNNKDEEYLLLWKNSPKPKMPFNLSPFAVTLNDLPGDKLSTLNPVERSDLKPWLPKTDCRLRPDQRAFEIGLYDLANDLKIRNEEKQRHTRKLREIGKIDKHKPRWFIPTTDKDTGERVWQPTRSDDGVIEYWNERECVGNSKLNGKQRDFKNVDDVSKRVYYNNYINSNYFLFRYSLIMKYKIHVERIFKTKCLKGGHCLLHFHDYNFKKFNYTFFCINILFSSCSLISLKQKIAI